MVQVGHSQNLPRILTCLCYDDINFLNLEFLENQISKIFETGFVSRVMACFPRGTCRRSFREPSCECP